MKDIHRFSDIVFISIDLEVSRQERSKAGVPLVKEFGIATLDTRRLSCLASPSVATGSISTQQFSTSHASKDFLDCDVTDFKECVFADTSFVPQRHLATAITKSLRIQDETLRDSGALRDIIIIGHSIKYDLKLLQRLGVNAYEIAPVLAILDTHSITRHLLGPNSATPSTSFQLGALLAELHNAGNNATYTLHAMLILVIRSCERREMGLVERENLERLEVVA